MCISSDCKKDYYEWEEAMSLISQYEVNTYGSVKGFWKLESEGILYGA
jgi:hypothetical protein